MSDDVNNSTTQTEESSVPDEAQRAQEKIQRLQGLLATKEKEYAKMASIYKDIDPDEYKLLRTKLEEKEREAAEKDPQKMEELFQRKLDKIRNELETERDGLREQLEGLAKVNKTLAVTDKVMSEIGGLFNTDAAKWIKK